SARIAEKLIWSCASAASACALMTVASAEAFCAGSGQILLMPSSISFAAAATASSMPNAISAHPAAERRADDKAEGAGEEPNPAGRQPALDLCRACVDR